jgi:16S rRNA (uracil1498-N3)-methyltransferase
LRRFFVEEISIQDGLCSITGSEAKHITKVLRMRKGDILILVDGEGSRFQAIIESATPKEVQVAIEKELPAPPPSPVEISLCQALLKSRSMDYLVQKTSELGVASIYPFCSERTIIRPKEEGLTNKVSRWREIAKSSTKQSDRTIIPDIHPIWSFRELVGPEGGFGQEEVVSARNAGFTSVSLGYRILRAETAAVTLVAVVQYEWGDLSLSPL